MPDSRGLPSFRFLRNLGRNSPWLVMAVALHVILIGVAALSYVHRSDSPPEERGPKVSYRETRKDLPLVAVDPPPIVRRREIPPDEIIELVPDDVDIPPLFDADATEDLTKDIGDPSSTSEIFNAGEASNGSIGVGTTGEKGGHKPKAFGVRGNGLGERLTKDGRPPRTNVQSTDRAVFDGLCWLLRHQNEDGSCSLGSMREHCDAQRPCFEDEKDLVPFYDEGLTSLALLCFLGAGFSHESKHDIVDTVRAKRHRVGDAIKRGLRWLCDRQNSDGSFSRDKAFMYNEALATMAMCEAYGLTQNRFWKGPAQKGVDFLQNAQRPAPDGQGLWGWRYASRMEVEDFRREGSQDAAYKQDLYDSDTSVTAWCVMALKSAQLAGLEVKPESMAGAMKFCNFVTAEEGLVGYLDAKGAGATITGPGDNYIYHPATMSALGMCIRIFSQHDPDDPFLDLAAKQIIKDLPKDNGDKKNPTIDYYYWYYGSLALNQLDGPDSPRKSGKYWGPWNKAMVDAVIALQNGAERSCNNGGWITPDRWAHQGGPIYTTAINILTLEVYYRYENAFGGAKREKK